MPNVLRSPLDSYGYAAVSAVYARSHFYGADHYFEIQVHPTTVRIDVYLWGKKIYWKWFAAESVRGLAIAIANGSDCFVILADAVEEETGNDTIAKYLRKAGKFA